MSDDRADITGGNGYSRHDGHEEKVLVEFDILEHTTYHGSIEIDIDSWQHLFGEPWDPKNVTADMLIDYELGVDGAQHTEDDGDIQGQDWSNIVVSNG